MSVTYMQIWSVKSFSYVPILVVGNTVDDAILDYCVQVTDGDGSKYADVKKTIIHVELMGHVTTRSE